MRPTQRLKVTQLATRAAAMALLGLVPAFARAETSMELGNTLPADLKPIELRFRNAGVVKKITVREGDAIKADQIILEQDDTEELDELEVLKLDATDIRVQGQRVNADAKKAEYDRIKQIHDAGAQNDLELVKAEAEWKLSMLTIKQEEQDLLVKQAKVKKQEGVIRRMQLKSPVNGVVQAIDTRQGEMVDPSKPAVITIVRNDPLVVEVILPTAASQKLQLGRPLRVSYDRKQWNEAKVTYLAPMAETGSGLQKVHLSLPNPEGRSSGLQTFVELPDDLTQAIKTAEADRQKSDARIASHE